MKSHDARPRRGGMAVLAAVAALAALLSAAPAGAQATSQTSQTSQTAAAQGNTSVLDTSRPLSEDALFGGTADIVRVIDTATASAGVVELVAENKTYPVFIVEGAVQAGLFGRFTPVGATAADSQSLKGAVDVGSLSITLLPSKNYRFGLTFDGTITSAGPTDVTSSAYADLRVSEFVRAYASGSFAYDTSTVTAATFSLTELFVDTAIGRSAFFRLGKQRVSWGVGYWYRPSDVLSLASIDPDAPTATREGPFAFKGDMPFGLNHASLYLVPSVTGEPLASSAAARADIVVGGFELSAAAFARADMAAKPRSMLMFSGAIGSIDTYGEAVVALGSDRRYVRAGTGGGYETYLAADVPVAQATLGAKWDWSTSDGFGLALHVQGYYNGTGYEDATILTKAAARAALRAADPGRYSANIAEPGMWYAAGSGTVSQKFGSGKSSGSTSLTAYALANFSDGSVRFKPTWNLTLGDQGGKLDLDLSALTALGTAASQYAPYGNVTTPALEVTVLDKVVVSAQVPVYLDPGYAVTKVKANFGIYWKAVSY